MSTDPVMPAETLEALRGSIAKWERIVARTDIDRGSANCPLCEMFADKKHCGKCPVAVAAGYSGCVNTPYMEGEFQWQVIDGRRSYQPTDTTAREELDFLKSLLPREAVSALDVTEKNNG